MTAPNILLFFADQQRADTCGCYGNGWKDAGSDTCEEAFLYDLETDPHELDNRANDPSLAEVRKELAARLVARMIEAGEPPTTITV